MKNIALITGASSGIGKELAHIHAEHGGDLVIVARRKEKLHELKIELEDKHGVHVHVLAKDLTDPAAPKEIFEAVQAENIKIDLLINNAGFGGHGKFHERDWEDDQAMIHLNVMALTELCRLFLPEFIERGQGRILNVSSTASLPPGGPLQATYFATKHFVTALSYGIAGEIADSNVTVTALLPGATESEFATTSGMHKTALFAKAVSARSVAEDGYRGMLSGKHRVVTGLKFSQKILMSLMPFLPKKMVLAQIKKMQETSD